MANQNNTTNQPRLFNIEPVEFKRGLKVLGVGTKITAKIDYTAFADTARAYFKIIDDNNMVIQEDNADVPITGWIDDDIVLIKNLCGVLELIYIGICEQEIN